MPLVLLSCIDHASPTILLELRIGLRPSLTEAVIVDQLEEEGCASCIPHAAGVLSGGPHACAVCCVLQEEEVM